MLILNASLTNFNPASLPMVYFEQLPGFAAADIAFRQHSLPSYLQSHFLFHIHYLGCIYLKHAGDQRANRDYAFSLELELLGLLLIPCFPARLMDWLENIISKLVDITLTEEACEDDPCCKQSPSWAHKEKGVDKISKMARASVKLILLIVMTSSILAFSALGASEEHKQVGTGENDWWTTYPAQSPAPGSEVNHSSWVLDALKEKPVVIYVHKDCTTCKPQTEALAEIVKEYGDKFTYYDLVGNNSDEDCHGPGCCGL